MSREPAEVQEALQTVSQTLSPLKERKTITWLLDSGCDDVAVWRTSWEAQEHLVCRVYHLERLVSFQDRHGQWQAGTLGQARGQIRPLARVQTTLVTKRDKQARAKKQPVEVKVAACPVRLTYSTGVRRQRAGEQVTGEVWLVEVHSVGSDQDPWLGLSDWPGTSEQSAARIFTMSRERQGSRGQLQVFANVSGMGRGPGVGLAGGSRLWSPWGGSQLAFSMGSAKARDWAEVQLLAKLGGS